MIKMYPLGTLGLHVVCAPNVFTMCPLGIWALVPSDSGSIIQLEGKKAKEVKARFDALEQRITGQDDQIKVLLHRLDAAEEGCCQCWESSPKVISCRCFGVIAKLTEDVQEATVEPETGGLEYEDEEVEAFHHSLIDGN